MRLNNTKVSSLFFQGLFPEPASQIQEAWKQKLPEHLPAERYAASVQHSVSVHSQGKIRSQTNSQALFVQSLQRLYYFFGLRKITFYKKGTKRNYNE